MRADRRETFRVLRAQAGDRAALGALFETLQRPLHRYLLGLVGRPELAEDVLQEVFLRVYRKIGWLREPELFRPWVYRIATREAFKHLRSERSRAEVAEDVDALIDTLPAPPGPSADGLLDRLPALAERLSPSSRAVVLLHYAQDLTLDEVADVLGVPIGTVKSRLAYGLGALRDHLKGEQP